MQTRRRAFTLIELLVVISIVALLISMLLPSLAKAREAANVISCMSRMQQIYLLTTQYQNDSDNYYVSCHFYPGGNPVVGWNAFFGYQLRPYLPATMNQITNYASSPKTNLLMCPNTRYRFTSPVNVSANVWPHLYAGNGLVIGYEATMQFGGGNASSWTTPAQKLRYYPKNRLDRPQPIPYFMEISGSSPYLAYTSVGPVKYNHFDNTVTNVAYDTGHIKTWRENLQTAYSQGRFKFW